MHKISIFRRILLIHLGLLIGLFTNVYAQRYPSQETFGKNRIQYKKFNWKVFRTTNFEIYHHQGGTELAKLTAQHAETEFDRITDLLGWTPYNRVKIFLYNSPAELEQSNMGLSTEGNLDDNKLDLAQSRIEVAYTGDQAGFKNKLINDISLLFVYDMLYGGNMREALQNSLLLTVPEWFMSGTAAYISEGWSPELSDYMRDFFLNRKVRKPTLMTGKDATLIGQSIWNYVVERYGKEKISDILNLTRIIRNEQSSISSTLGTPSYNRFLRDWKDYYVQKNKIAEAGYVKPNPTWAMKLDDFGQSSQEIEAKVSLDNKWTAISEVKNGRYRVSIVDNETKKKKIIRQGKADAVGARNSVQAPLIGWTKKNLLAIMAKENDRNNLYVYENIDSRKLRIKLKRNLRGLDQINEMDISQDGTMLAVSADKGGQNDVFLVSIARASALPLTNDIFDDLSPRFVNGSSRKIVFASNRPTDSLVVGKGTFKQISPYLSIFEHDGSPRSSSIPLLLEGSNQAKVQPVYADAQQVVYLSNIKGISNLYRFDRVGSRSTQLTNYIFGIRSADVLATGTGALAYTYLYEGNYQVAYQNNFNLNTSLDSPSLYQSAEVEAAKPVASEGVNKDSVAVAPEKETLVLRDGEVDTDHYEFDEDVLKNFESRSRRGTFANVPSSLPRSRPVRENIAIKGPYPYKGLFINNDTNSDWRIDPIRGFGYSQNIAMNDLLENHVIKAGLFVNSTFKNLDLYAEYWNNTNRIDFGLRVDRKSLYMEAEGSPQKYKFNQVMLSFSYPFSESSRLTVSPMYSSTRMIDVYILANPDLASSYGGVRTEYVFDNTRVRGVNMLEGTRFKIRYDNQLGLTNSNESFNRISLDFRHYQKVHRDIIFAIRAAASHSAGKAPKQSILGGMENWISNRQDSRATNDPLNFGPTIDNRDIFFADFATNLRGFNLNKLSGTSYMLLNAELRIPLIKYLYRGSITSSFLRNFQIIGFGDIGTAWTGKGPFSENNNLNTQIIGVDGDPFRATVTDFNNPYLMGYGLGARSTLFGFYVKLDYAWGVDNGYTNKPIPYVTLGYDF
ncbi:surface antigen-like protein [Dyadobacter jejuensis]|uniref:Surface antigen-like protein n=1 Tax=Dyadobacter jejuensis TaxID=1082580 RepID=A0A316AMT0_9BACT|nr:BamA/TamA family outer membrane protein [Dyadobacter jejuensis]PWJ58404.1 surface antigen-like protein [Dyadobacter jejuensis]